MTLAAGRDWLVRAVDLRRAPAEADVDWESNWATLYLPASALVADYNK